MAIEATGGRVEATGPADGAPAPTAAAPAETAVFRASPRVVIAHFRLAALLAALAALGWWLRLASLPRWFAFASVVQVFWWLHAVVGRVELREDAVRVRRMIGPKTIAVPDVARFIVRTTVFGRHLRLEPYLRREIRLPAPVSPRLAPDPHFDERVDRIRQWCRSRFGGAAGPVEIGGRPRWAYPLIIVLLTVAAVLPDRPWGWVGSEVPFLPPVCDAVRGHATDLAGSNAGEPYELALGEPREVGCTWSVDSARSLMVVMAVYRREGLHSGESMATRHVLDIAPGPYAWSTGQLKPLPDATGLGDSALSAYFGDDGIGGWTGAIVVIRKANVIVVAYLGADADKAPKVVPPVKDEEARQLVAVARAAVRSLPSR